MHERIFGDFIRVVIIVSSNSELDFYDFSIDIHLMLDSSTQEIELWDHFKRKEKERKKKVELLGPFH